jgi:CheY-specific phosphatase CheX
VKDIICITDEKAWRYSFIAAMKKTLKDDEAVIAYINPRVDGVKNIASSLVDFIIIAATTSKKDIEEIFKLISKNENAKAHIFLIASDFEQFNEVLKVGNFPHLHLLSTPINFEELAHLIRTIIHPLSMGKGKKVTLEFLKTFVDSTKYILSDFCALTDIIHQKPMLLNESNTKKYDIEASIHLKSDYFEGYFFLSFTKEVYFKIIEKVLGEVATEINAGNVDFSAELVNMVYGQAKVHLNESGHNFPKVFPKYVPMPPVHVTKNPVFLVPIDCSAGTIDMKVEILP